MALSLLKGLAPFAPLPSAEAAVFEAHMEPRGFSNGERVLADDALLVVGEGLIGLSVEDPGGRRSFTVVGAGDLIGELTLFEPTDPARGQGGDEDSVLRPGSADPPRTARSFNGDRIREHELEDRAEFQVGSTRFMLILADAE